MPTIDHGSITPVYQQLAAILRGAIERGEYAPGRQLPSEPTLAGEYGIARETARKAIRVLVAEGLVTVVQGRGAFVAERS